MGMPVATNSGPPFFIVGTGRSGSTMFRLMLDSHPEIAIPGESEIIPDLWRRRDTYTLGGRFDAARLAKDMRQMFHFSEWKLNQEILSRRLQALDRPGFAETIEAFFMAYAEERGKRRWGDKTPAYVLHIPLLARLFPGSQFVHLIRDGRDVCLSTLEVEWGPDTVALAAHMWNGWVRKGRSDGRTLGAGRYLEVYYEELVEDAPRVLTEVCRFLDLPYSEEMLRYHERADDTVPAQEARHHPRGWKPPIIGARDWRRDMPIRDVARFEAIAGATLSQCGYERRFPRLAPTVRARARSRLLTDQLGRGVGRARRRVARTLNLTHSAPPGELKIRSGRALDPDPEG
jgi:hypothetical protein